MRHRPRFELRNGGIQLTDLELQRLNILDRFVQHVGGVGGLLHVGHQVLELLHALTDASSPHSLRDAAWMRGAAALRTRSHLDVMVVARVGCSRSCCRCGQACVSYQTVLIVEPE